MYETRAFTTSHEKSMKSGLRYNHWSLSLELMTLELLVICFQITSLPEKKNHKKPIVRRTARIPGAIALWKTWEKDLPVLRRTPTLRARRYRRPLDVRVQDPLIDSSHGRKIRRTLGPSWDLNLRPPAQGMSASPPGQGGDPWKSHPWFSVTREFHPQTSENFHPTIYQAI